MTTYATTPTAALEAAELTERSAILNAIDEHGNVDQLAEWIADEYGHHLWAADITYEMQQICGHAFHRLLVIEHTTDTGTWPQAAHWSANGILYLMHPVGRSAIDGLTETTPPYPAAPPELGRVWELTPDQWEQLEQRWSPHRNTVVLAEAGELPPEPLPAPLITIRIDDEDEQP